MKYIDDENEFELSTGTRFYANCGVLGMDCEGMRISEGWDGGVDERNFTADEKAEIADFMVARWLEWCEPSKYLSHPLAYEGAMMLLDIKDRVALRIEYGA